jgi:hypothetical protein
MSSISSNMTNMEIEKHIKALNRGVLEEIKLI